MRPPDALHVIVPTLDEATALPMLLGDLQAQGQTMSRVLVVDGGSGDATLAVARAAGCRVVMAPAGRARQLQAGVAAAGDVPVWMLHADSRLLPGALAAARRLVSSGAAAWGRFGVRLDDRHPLLRLVALLINLRSCASGIATGDQGLVFAPGVLASVGGVPQQPLMEDVELCVRLKCHVGRPACLPVLLQTSARRWRRHGILRTILTMWRLRWRYARGADPAELHRIYYGRAPA